MATDYTSIVSTMTKNSPLVAGILGQLGTGIQEEQDAAAQMEAQAKQAAEQAETARNAALAAAAQPEEEVDPMRALIARTVGGISNALSGTQSGTQTAESTLQEKRKTLLTRRQENLALLVDASEKAALRAEKLGDSIAATKHRAAVERNLKLLDVGLNASVQIEEGAKDRSAAYARAQLGADAAISTASIRQGLDRLPPELQATLKPLYEHFDQLAEAKGALLGATKKAPDAKRMTALDKQMNALQGDINATIAAYGKSAGASGMSYGDIITNARQQGVLTSDAFTRQMQEDPRWQSDLRRMNLDPEEVLKEVRAVLPSEADVKKKQRELKLIVRENTSLAQPVSGPLQGQRTAQRRAQAAANTARIKAITEQLRAWGYDVTFSTPIK